MDFEAHICEGYLAETKVLVLKFFLRKDYLKRNLRVFDLKIITSTLQNHTVLLLFYAELLICIKIVIVPRPQVGLMTFHLCVNL